MRVFAPAMIFSELSPCPDFAPEGGGLQVEGWSEPGSNLLLGFEADDQGKVEVRMQNAEVWGMQAGRLRYDPMPYGQRVQGFSATTLPSRQK
jgi:hypothetical protein